MDLKDATIEQLKQAIEIREQITELERQLNELWDGGNGRGVIITQGGHGGTAGAYKATFNNLESPSTKPKPSRKISPAGIARIRAAQKKRWAKLRRAK